MEEEGFLKPIDSVFLCLYGSFIQGGSYDSTREISRITQAYAGEKHWCVCSTNCRFSSEWVCWGTFQGKKVYHQLLRICRNGSDYVKRCKALDWRSLLYPSCQAAGRYNRYPDEDVWAGCSQRKRILGRDFAVRTNSFLRRTCCFRWRRRWVCRNSKEKRCQSRLSGRLNRWNLDWSSSSFRGARIFLRGKIHRRKYRFQVGSYS